MPERFERREFRQPDWSKTSIIHFDTSIDDHSAERRKVPITLEQWEALHDRLEGMSSDPAVRTMLKQLEAYREILLDPSGTQDLAVEWQAQFPQADVRRQALEHHPNLQPLFKSLERPFVISTSSTHRSTAEVFQALEDSGQFNMASRAVVSFDHHSDLEGVNSVEPRKDKANVMGYLINKKLIDGLAVFGTSRLFASDTDRKHHVITSPELYSEDGSQPMRQEFIKRWRAILEQWRDERIQQLYVSVDLDGLRLPSQLYSATDYNSIDLLRQFAQQQDTMTDEKILRFYKGPDPAGYQGIPAAWVPLAMRMARQEYGMTLGIQRARSEQRVIGDVVEYTGADYHGNTARIAGHLLRSMVAETQLR